MTTFNMNFDFTSSEQRDVLQYLQENNYQLLGYKGAKGPNQVTAGVPTWFVVPFGYIFGKVNIDYTPKYKVYVYNKANIAAYETIRMQVLSGEIPLGKGLIFNPDGSFSAGTTSVPAASIMLINNRPSGTPNITVGLAGLVNLPTGSIYLPFCAFTLTPQASINMTPMETICLFAARTNLQSGNVQAMAAAPGCSFSFSSSIVSYDLEIRDGIYEITNVPGKPMVKGVNSGAALIQLLSS